MSIFVANPIIKPIHMRISQICSLVILYFSVANLQAQNDTIYFSASNMIVGEVKDMSRGVLTVETDYSDSDFKIEWQKVKRFHSKEF